MNRIDRRFREGSQGLLSIYMTAGYPVLESTPEIIRELASAGADMIEIGMPFSDPLADGPALQACNQQALENGMSLKVLFRQLEGIRRDVDIPLILMGYLNPVLNYGMEAFCERAAKLGMDGVILPDLPMEVFLSDYKDLFNRHGLHMIFLVTPQTSKERIREIDRASGGFIYLVSAASTTGAKKEFLPEQIDYFQRIREMNLSNPCMIGFGISSAESFRQACDYASGAIIGSAFMNKLGQSGSIRKNVQEFVEGLKV